MTKDNQVIQVALWEPEIPPNTGNIARLCAACGVPLHLIGRLGFRLDDRNLKRAGCDYWDVIDVRLHVDFDAFEQSLAGSRIICFSAHAKRPYSEIAYQANDCLLF